MKNISQTDINYRVDLPYIVTYEDRTSAIPGAMLLALSLTRLCPKLKLIIYTPLLELRETLEHFGNIEVIYTDELIGEGWNVKPTILLKALENCSSVMWLDTDIIISGDLTKLIDKSIAGEIIVGQEFRGVKRDGGQLRADGWGLNVGRLIDYHVNSGSVKVDRSHKDLLTDWKNMLLTKEYISIQKAGWPRPAHMAGDQDVLWALLVSSKYAKIPVRYFKAGKDMILHSGANGYHIFDRIRHAFTSDAAFVHMLGPYKPWSFQNPPSLLKNKSEYVHMACFELSPYHSAANAYATQISNPLWLKRRTMLAKLCNALAFGNVSLRGLPIAVTALLGDKARSLLNFAK